MRSFLVATAAAVILLTAATSEAAEPPKKPETAPAAPKELPAAGSNFEFNAGMRYLGGGIARGVTLGTFEATFAFHGGYYFTPHFGVMTGIEIGTGFMTTGCVKPDTGKDSTECAAFSARVPLVAQYAFDRRAVGPYLQGGLIGGNIQLLTANPSANTSQSLFLVSPVDLSLGGGIRIPLKMDDPKLPPRTLDFNLRADAGQFMYGSYKSTNSAANGGEIPTDRRAFHIGVMIAAGTQW